MERILSVAIKYANVELARIKRDTASKLASLREKSAADGIFQSSMYVRQVKTILEEEVTEHGEASWTTLHDILESSPRRFYRASEIDAVREWARKRLSSAEGLVESLKAEATRANQTNSSTFPPIEKELETACTKARERLEAEVEKYFCTRRDWWRWFMEFTQHPIVSHAAIGIIAFLAALLVRGCD